MKRVCGWWRDVGLSLNLSNTPFVSIFFENEPKIFQNFVMKRTSIGDNFQFYEELSLEEES